MKAGEHRGKNDYLTKGKSRGSYYTSPALHATPAPKDSVHYCTLCKIMNDADMIFPARENWKNDRGQRTGARQQEGASRERPTPLPPPFSPSCAQY